MTAPAPALGRLRASHADRGAQRRELYFFTLFRVFQAAILAFFVFSPTGLEIAELRHPWLARGLAVSYLVLSVGLMLFGRRQAWGVARQAAIGLAIDIVVTLLARAALEGPDVGLALLLIVNIGAGALLLPFRWGMGFAAAASLGTLIEFVFAHWRSVPLAGSAAETAMFVITYLATAVLCHSLGRQLRESLELAEQRGAQAANLAQITELIIRRLQSGVLVVGADRQIRLINESAWHQLGQPNAQQRDLGQLSPALSARLGEWLQHPDTEPSSLSLRSELPDVIPRFTRLGTADDLFLVFLDDGSLVSRRAEQLTLSTLGRLSASIAHEIRNPLAAIHHAAQLLEESPALPGDDRRLVEIVLTHCQRMNGIVGNVLALSRRERSRPEPIDLSDWLRRFVETFRSEHFINADNLRLGRSEAGVRGMFDPQQLHQVLSALVSNALRHGHLPDQRAVVTLSTRFAEDSGFPTVEVCDLGPGIPAGMRERIFDPFYTTSDLGSGLGLYIARELCEANQAALELAAPSSGCCFRLTLARPVSMQAGMIDWTAGSGSTRSA